MVASQNGWRANDSSVIASIPIPGSSRSIRLRKDAPGLLLAEVGSAFDRLVEDIDPGQLDDWGYAERDIRGSTQVSNHASGTAIDLNATRHPLGTNPTANYSQAQINTIHQIIGVTGNVVRWGGDYTGRKDPMHFEINDGRTMEQCQTALNAMRTFNTHSPTVPAKPTSPAPTPSGANLQKGSSGAAVTRLQQILNKVYPAYSHLVVDGVFGNATDAVVREFQKRSKIAVDGIVGPTTKRLLGL